MHRRLASTVLVLAITAASCGSADGSTGPVESSRPLDASAPAGAIVLNGTGCSSTIPSRSASGNVGFEIQNQTTTKMAVIMGSYAEGYERGDLVSYGRDVSTRPDFLVNPEIYEVAPDSNRQITVEREPGRYFTICMDTPSTMIVLDDLVIGANDDPDLSGPDPGP